uniref:ORC_WH_C domain-containing protein n=1 Tax=Parastrongyloides trichosuri TaxID=131310 RepID=A0A0N4Z2D8_PARTI
MIFLSDDLISTVVFERGFYDVTKRLTDLSHNLIDISSTDQSFSISTFIKLLITNINKMLSVSCNTITELMHQLSSSTCDDDEKEKLFIVIKQTESFPSVTIDKIINILHELKLPVILICCVSTNDNTIFTKCSRSNYQLLDIKCASVNSPEIIFDKSLKFNTYKNVLVETLQLLHNMTSTSVCCKSLWELYTLIYSDETFFDKNNSEFGEWISSWSMWSKDICLDYMEKINSIIHMDNSLYLKQFKNNAEILLINLKTLDGRILEISKQIEETNVANNEIKSNNKRLSKAERQKNLMKRMEDKKNLDLFGKDKKDIFSFLTLFFKAVFYHINTSEAAPYYYIKSNHMSQKLINPPSDYSFDIDLNKLLNESDQFSHLKNTEKLDLPLSYKILQSLTSIYTTKPISIEKWKQAFIKDCSSNDRADLRFRKTFKILKQLGIIKEAAESNDDKVVLLHHSCILFQ